jgi:hypothetical protein
MNTKQFLKFYREIKKEFGEDALYENDLEDLVGRERLFGFFNQSFGVPVATLISVLTEALDKTDESCDVLVENFISWYNSQPWVKNKDFETLATDPYLNNFVEGYRVIDGKLLNQNEIPL